MSQTTQLADNDYANLRGAYSYLGVIPLSRQEELFLLTHLRGVSMTASARAAGMSPERGKRLLERDDIEKVKDFFRKQLFEGARITLSMLNSMTLEAHRKSVNTTEEVKSIEALAKLNQIGAYASQYAIKEKMDREKAKERDVTPKSHKELERMDEGALLALAGLDGMGALDPEPEPVPGAVAPDATQPDALTEQPDLLDDDEIGLAFEPDADDLAPLEGELMPEAEDDTQISYDEVVDFFPEEDEGDEP